MKWEPPVSLPRFTDEEIKRKKRDYTREHGYYVSFPKIRDIIHVRRHEEPTDEEYKLWRKGDRNALGNLRFDEIDTIIRDKRRRYNQILSSPVPTIAENAVSVLTFLDDINDTLGTAALVARFAAKLAPRALARFFLGPAGWLLLAAEIVGLIMHMLKAALLTPAFCIMGKRSFRKYGEMNPFSKKAKSRRARKLRRLTPSKGEIIEALQVTDSMFGIGLCLGPIMGLAWSIPAGAVRSIRGEKVTWFREPPPMHEYEKTAFKTLHAAPIAAHLNPILTDEEHVGMYWALFSAAQVAQAYNNEFDILDNTPTLDGLQVQAPYPELPTTLHVLRETGWNGRDGIGWPGIDRRWIEPEKLWDVNQEPGSNIFMHFSIRNRANYPMAFGVQAAADFSKLMVLMASDPGSVEVEWEEHHQGWADFLENGCTLHNCGDNFRWGADVYHRATWALGDQCVQLD